MTQHIETIIVGGGQAGLATSYYLKQHGCEHLILEQAAQPANAWRNDRWDSFALLTPNWTVQMPGMGYDGADRDGFMPRDEIVAYFERYIERFQPLIQYGTQVTAVEKTEQGYRVATHQETYDAHNVVMATGLFQKPKIPVFAANIPPSIMQLHSGSYRNPAALPEGAVLVVGSAQSGCQIAEEVYQRGRKVYLCTGSGGRAPRRYRGKDVFEWLYLTGFFERTTDQLPSPKAKFAGNPHLSGKSGGHSINLHRFVRDGVMLLGRIRDAHDSQIFLAPDLKENLTKSDQFEANIIQLIDGYIARGGLDAPEEHLPQLRDGYDVPVIEQLDLQVAGITTIIWAMGYAFDFSPVKLPLFDGDGYPVQQRGVTGYPGLYFVGLPWLSKYKSGLLVGVGEDAAYIAEHIVSRK
jgi:putative flavoprotein involved in K+ transport